MFFDFGNVKNVRFPSQSYSSSSSPLDGNVSQHTTTQVMNSAACSLSQSEQIFLWSRLMWHKPATLAYVAVLVSARAHLVGSARRAWLMLSSLMLKGIDGCLSCRHTYASVPPPLPFTSVVSLVHLGEGLVWYSPVCLSPSSAKYNINSNDKYFKSRF